MAGSRLRAIGRITEAYQAFRTSYEQRTNDPVDDAFRARHMSEILVLMGSLVDHGHPEGGALHWGGKGVSHADYAGDDGMGTYERIAEHAVYGDALLQAGFHTKALSEFENAEKIQNVNNDFEYLHSLWGVRYLYCLFHDHVSRYWRVRLSLEPGGAYDDNMLIQLTNRAGFIVTTAQRGESKAEGKRGLGKIDEPLGMICLATIELLRTVGKEQHHNGDSFVRNAVQQLRSTNKVEFILLGLITQAWILTLAGEYFHAQSDLDEAWEIASRGPMPLFLADIHLHRARLFGIPRRAARPSVDRPPSGDGSDSPTPSDYPWDSVEHDLSEARRLIEKHGYGRRTEELEDAELALLGEVGGND